MTERSQITVWETDALIEALIVVGRRLTPDERAISIAIAHRFTEMLIDLQAELLDMHRRLVG